MSHCTGKNSKGGEFYVRQFWWAAEWDSLDKEKQKMWVDRLNEKCKRRRK